MQTVKKPKQQLRTHPGIYFLLLTLLALGIAAAANLAAGALPAGLTKIDVTGSGLYTLSAESKKTLAALADDVTVYVLAQSAQKDETLDEFLARFAAESPRIRVEYKDPVLYPYFALEYTNLVLSDNSLIVAGAKRSTVIDVTESYTAETAGDGETVYGFQAEPLLAAALEYVSRDDLPRLYLLQGHGESQPTAAAQELVQREGFLIVSLKLLTLEGVPAVAGAVLVCAPSADLSAQEAQMLLAYLQSGGKLLLWTDPGGEAMPNLEGVLAYYGLSAVEGIVLEGDAAYHLSNYPHYILPTLAQHAVTAPLLDNGYPALAALAHGIAIAGDLRASLAVLPLLTTSDSSYLKSDALGAETLEREAGDQPGPFVLGAAAEETTAAGRTQLIWYATGMLLDDTTDSVVSGANTLLLVSSLDWLAQQKAESAAVLPKSLSAPPLVMSAAQAALWKVLLGGVLPACVLGAGLWVRGARRRR